MPDIPPGEQKCPWCGLHVPLIHMGEERYAMRHDNRDGSVCEGSLAAAQENEEP